MIGVPLLLMLLAGAVCGLLALSPSRRNLSGDTDLAVRIDALLPQTQCGQCGYQGCAPYAAALARGAAEINRCPPGGDATIRRLAAMLGRPVIPLDPECGAAPPPQVALIDEERCIGCWKCVRACPVDAIIGAPRHMHTVLPALCTGCELCVPPCPVDCIDMAAPVYDSPRAAQLVHIAAAEQP